MPRPTLRAVTILALAILPAALSSWSPSFGVAALAIDAALLVVWLADLWLGRQASGALLVRRLPDRISRLRPFEVELEVQNPGARPLRIRVEDLLPRGFEPRQSAASLTVPPFANAVVRRHATAGRRGDYALLPVVGER
jgi:hypothetical protein